MQKGLGIAALVIAILSMFVPFLGTWLTILVALLAAFAYGPGLGLGIASIILSVIHIILFSPVLWAVQGGAEFGADVSGAKIVFWPYVLIAVQVGATALLFVLQKSRGSRPSVTT